MSEKAVVVGFDLAESSRRAVRWAAREAAGRGRPLLLVHALTWPFEEHTTIRVPGEGDVAEPLQQALRRELAQLVEECRRIDADLPVRSELPFGDPAEVLAAMAADADLLVLGGPRLEPSAGIGATSAELLARRGGAPVVVVRGGADQPGSGPVVVGVDGSATSRAAIGFAFDFASRNRCELVTAHAWSDLPLDPFQWVSHWELAWAEVHEEAAEVLAESVAGWVEQYPDVVVRRVVTPEKPTEALLREAEGASLLVVGSHGRGRFRRSFLGSVSHAVVNRAPCPVAVLRAA
ncbi:Nucleotide-binding universal stress protein, UspA family [Saccharopolyspora antimicrobica]|uniref:Nucleotide-binding universal stress UspA family protein n=1 Tax=Saccharopolyspora antimicrobica TaxID=455193 RepID=A0A1I4TS11_9PSEU|nr:universal stress protein [Saccharopolyspora antimicrobica]RKT88524.1 nucleotide-binding universal stress UspA family protein [Saccharopolyspora antimicrobica]SFM79355.1 Nucleotide-binding universal stress protein, UspA family [Saccharopolyspora antimicrobica]